MIVMMKIMTLWWSWKANYDFSFLLFFFSFFSFFAFSWVDDASTTPVTDEVVSCDVAGASNAPVTVRMSLALTKLLPTKYVSSEITLYRHEIEIFLTWQLRTLARHYLVQRLDQWPWLPIRQIHSVCIHMVSRFLLRPLPLLAAFPLQLKRAIQSALVKYAPEE